MDPAAAAAAAATAEGGESQGKEKGPMGPVMSMPVQENDDVVPEDAKTAFDWCREHRTADLQRALQRSAGLVRETDDGVRAWVELGYRREGALVQLAGQLKGGLSALHLGDDAATLGGGQRLHRRGRGLAGGGS